MQFSESTLSLLKNLAAINPQMLFRKGHLLRTVNQGKTILVEATIDESLPTDFAIHDLNNFLSVLSLDESSDLRITEKEVQIVSQDQQTTLHYRCCEPGYIEGPPEKNLKLPTNDCEFLLSEKDLLWVSKCSSVLQSPQIGVSFDGTAVKLLVLDAQNDAASVGYRGIHVKTVIGLKPFKALFKTENWKLIPGEYTVTLSLKGIGHFQHTTKKLQYWIALEGTSKGSK